MSGGGSSFNVFIYDAVLGRDSNPSLTRKQADVLRVTPQSRELYAK